MNDGDTAYLKIQADRDAYEKGLADLQEHPEKVQALLAAKGAKTDPTAGMQPPKSPGEAQQQATAVEGPGAGASMQPIESKAAEAVFGAPGDLTAEALQSAGVAPEQAATAGRLVDAGMFAYGAVKTGIAVVKGIKSLLGASEAAGAAKGAASATTAIKDSLPSTEQIRPLADLEGATPEFKQAVDSLKPAVRDPETGKVYTDPAAKNHGEVYDSLPPEVAAKDKLDTGFVGADGEYMTRQQTHDHLIAAQTGSESAAATSPTAEGNGAAAGATTKAVAPTPAPQSLGAAAMKDYSTPQAASSTLAQKQADVISQLRMGEKGAERFGRPDLATKVPASETMAEGRALGLKPEDVFSQPPAPSQVAAESSALIDVLDNEAKDIHLTAADLQARSAAGEDVTQAKQEWWNRYQAYAMQAPKPIARGSDVARAEQLFDPRRVSIQRIAQTAKIAQQVPEGAIDQALQMTSKLTDQQLAASAYMTGRVADRGANWFDAILQGYKFGLIFNPKTVIRNITSNSTTQVAEIWARWLAGRLPGSQIPADEAALMLEGHLGGIKDALRLAKASAESGRPEFDIATEAKLSGTDAFQVPHVQYLDGPQISGDAFGMKGTPLGNAIDYIGAKVEKGYAYTLMAPDQFYKATGSSMQMYALAGRKANDAVAGLTGETKALTRAKVLKEILGDLGKHLDLVAQSRDYGDFLTFQNNLDRAWTKTISNVTNDWPLLQVVMPFRRTPLNIVEYGLDWLPLPVVNRNWRVALQAGAEGDIARAKIATGSAISSVIAGMYLKGLIKGEGAQNPELKKIQRDRGIQPNSFKVGDTWVGFPEPLKVPMSLVATGAELMDHVDDDLTKSQIGMAVALATAKAFTSAPALTGLSQMFEAMDGINNDDPDKAANFFRQEGAGMIPVSSLLRQINRASDPEYKESYSLLQKIGSNVPGSPFSQYPVRDYSGAAVHGQPGIIHNMLSPIDFSKETPDPVDDELLRVGVKIPGVPRQIFGNAAQIMQSPKDPAIGIELTPEQRDKWAIYRGEGIKEQLKTLMDSDGYKAANDFGKRQLLGQIFSVHGAIARARILGEFKDLLPKYANLLQKRAENFDATPPVTMEESP